MFTFKKGFSLIESLFSIAIISIVLVMVCIFYTYMMKVSSKGLDISIASQVAEGKLNQISSIYGDSNSLSIKNIQDFPYLKTGVDKVGNAEYYYLVKISKLEDIDQFYTNMNLYFADVLVFWLHDDNMIIKTEDDTLETVSFLNQIKEKFKGNNTITEAEIINTFKGKVTNFNEGYRFIRLSRLVSNS